MQGGLWMGTRDEVIAHWQKWREIDHEDVAAMPRSDVCILLDEIRALRMSIRNTAIAVNALFEVGNMRVPDVRGGEKER